MPDVRLDAMLREFAARTSLTSDATSLGDLFDDLERRFPRLRNRIRDETRRVRPFVRVFVNGEEVRDASGSSRTLGRQDHVDILQSIQGG